MEIQKRYETYMRNNERQQRANRNPSCPICAAEFPADIEAFKAHVKADAPVHAGLDSDADIEELFRKITLQPSAMEQQTETASNKNSRKRPVSGAPNSPDQTGDSTTLEAGSDAAELGNRGSKKLRSPARSKRSDSISDFDKSRASRNPTGRSLWGSEDNPQVKPPVSRPAHRPKSHRQSPTHTRNTKAPPHQSVRQAADAGPSANETFSIVKQPETRPISQEQLVAEVKGIYAGLVMVETRCIEVDSLHSSMKENTTPLQHEQWQALIQLHQTLLYEHHDFFLASQHPSAGAALRRLPSKYAMPARMWRHGIHSFLEVLRHQLPATLEHMLTFIYLAYSMMALLYETVPAFEDTWIECLGDLGRYRMAIEDDDIRDRETWTGVSRYWYSKASDKAPSTGRLYHHLAILARPNALQQLYFYVKSLCVPVPFLSARDSIMTLFGPILDLGIGRLPPVDADFVRVHAILFSGKSPERLESFTVEFLDLLDEQIARTTKGWLESGYFIGISLSCSLLEYGTKSNVLMKAISQRPESSDVVQGGDDTMDEPPTKTFEQAFSFTLRTYEVVIRRWGDTNILPFVHTMLVFVHHMTKFDAAMTHLEARYPWKLTALMLNVLKKAASFEMPSDSEDFPTEPKNQAPRPLPEDHAMRGLVYTEDYFPTDWFSNKKIDEDEKYFELASMTDERRRRIIWLGKKIAKSGRWLVWNEERSEFSAAKAYDIDLDIPARFATVDEVE